MEVLPPGGRLDFNSTPYLLGISLFHTWCTQNFYSKEIGNLVNLYVRLSDIQQDKLWHISYFQQEFQVLNNYLGNFVHIWTHQSKKKKEHFLNTVDWTSLRLVLNIQFEFPKFKSSHFKLPHRPYDQQYNKEKCFELFLLRVKHFCKHFVFGQSVSTNFVTDCSIYILISKGYDHEWSLKHSCSNAVLCVIFRWSD